MDDVFGNCSSETVMAGDLTKVLAHINQDIADLQYLELQLPPENPNDPQVFHPSRQTPMDQQQIQVNSHHTVMSRQNLPNQHMSPGQQKIMSHLQASLGQHNGPTTNLAHIVNQPSMKSFAMPLPVNSFSQKDGEGTFVKPTVTTRSTVTRVPVITSVGKRPSTGPQPQPRHLLETVSRGAALRHTQSAVVEKKCNDQSGRPRAQSTGATTHSNYQHVHYHMEYHHHNYNADQQVKSPREHSYVNINPVCHQLPQQEEQHTSRPLSQYDNIPSSRMQGPPPGTPMPPPQSAPPVLQAASAFPRMNDPSFQCIRMPQYVNLPNRNYITTSPLKKVTQSSEVSGRNSAPSTPRGGGGGPPRLHHSYIELWTGVKEERDSLSDSECEELKRSFQEPQTPHGPSPGYVEMSSPYVKSPQVQSPFNGSVLADLATKLASYAGHQPRNIFCPFCPRYFGFEKSLGSHIHKLHREELNSMVDKRPGEVKIQFCPICQARFFNTSVLPKHLIDFHRASVIEILEKNNCVLSDTSGIQCPFCVKKVPHGKTGEQVLLYHMQQLHLTDFEKMVQSKFQPYSSDSRESLKSISSTDVSEVIAFRPGLTSTPGLSGKLSTMSVRSVDSKRSMEALNLDATWSSHNGIRRSPMPLPPYNANNKPQVKAEEEEEDKENKKQLPTSVSKGILRNKSELGRKASVKRELRFSVPPVTSEEVFVPESPEQSTPERIAEQQLQNHQSQMPQLQNQKNEVSESGLQRTIPIRIDSLSAADFMDLTDKAGGQRKRRRLGLGLRSRKSFKKKDKENIGDRDLGNLVSGACKFVDNAKKLITEGSHVGEAVATQHTRTFRRPRPVPVPRVPELMPPMDTNTCQDSEVVMHVSSEQRSMEKENEVSEVSPFTHLKLYSPLRMFRCNSCRVKFCDNESLSCHIGSRHRGLLYLLRPQYGCGVCSAKFYENKYLVKHCLQHHTSLLEIRSPSKHKISIYRFTHV